MSGIKTRSKRETPDSSRRSHSLPIAASSLPKAGSMTATVISRTPGSMATRSSNLVRDKDGSFIYKRRSLDLVTPKEEAGSKYKTIEVPAAGSGRKRSVGRDTKSSTYHLTHTPKKRRTIRQAGGAQEAESDFYCWQCHREDGTVCCQLCPRTYHLRCLGLETAPTGDWVCTECERILRAECADTKSKAMSMLSLDQLCALLKYGLQRMRHSESAAFHRPVDVSQHPSYLDHIIRPMDLSTLEKNIRLKMYGSTEAFLADAQWILHNSTIFNGGQHELTAGGAKMIMKIAKHEMNEIEICPDCYLNSCIKRTENWFCEPCRDPHPLVWAKMKGYPFWPAKALREVNGQVDVRFFGEHDRAWVPVSQVFFLSEQPPTGMKTKKHGFEASMEELSFHIECIRKKFGSFEYSPFRTPYDSQHPYRCSKVKHPMGGDIPPPAPTKPTKYMKKGAPSDPEKTAGEKSAPVRKAELLGKSHVTKTATALKSKYNSIITTRRAKLVQARKKQSECPRGVGGQLKGQQDNETETDQGSQPKQSARSDVDVGESIALSLTPAVNTSIEVKREAKADTSIEVKTEVRGAEEDAVGPLEKEGTQPRLQTKDENSAQESVLVLGEKEHSIKEALAPASVAELAMVFDGKDTVKPLDKDGTGPGKIEELQSKDKNSAEASAVVPGGEHCHANQAADANHPQNTLLPQKIANLPQGKAAGLEGAHQTPKADAEPADEFALSQDTLDQESAGVASLSPVKPNPSLERLVQTCKEKLGMQHPPSGSLDREAAGDEEDEVLLTPSSNSEEETFSTTTEESTSESESASEVSIRAKGRSSPEPKDEEGKDRKNSLEDAKMPDMQTEGGGSITGQSEASTRVQSSKSEDSNTTHIKQSEESSTAHSSQSEMSNTPQGSTSAVRTTQSEMFTESQSEKRKGAEKTAEQEGKAASEEKGGNSAVQMDANSPDIEKSDSSENLTVDTDIGALHHSNGFPPAGKAKENSALPGNESTVVEWKEQQGKAEPQKSKDAQQPRKEESNAPPQAVDVSDTNTPLVSCSTASTSTVTLPISTKTSSTTNATTPISARTSPMTNVMSPVSPRAPLTKVMTPPVSSLTTPADTVTPPVTTQAQPIITLTPPTSTVTPPSSAPTQHASSPTTLASTRVNRGSPADRAATSRVSLAPSIQHAPLLGPPALTTAHPAKTAILSASLTTTTLAPISLTQPATTAASTAYSFSPIQSPSPGASSGPATSSSISFSLSETDLSKYTTKLLDTLQAQMHGICSELLKVEAAQAVEKHYRLQFERAVWRHQMELRELRHNADLRIAEMKSLLMEENRKQVAALRRKLEEEKRKAVEETKKKQWCANCGKEAIFYCCWNTSYCDYPCQQVHWPDHMTSCTHSQKSQDQSEGQPDGDGGQAWKEKEASAVPTTFEQPQVNYQHPPARPGHYGIQPQPMMQNPQQQATPVRLQYISRNPPYPPDHPQYASNTVLHPSSAAPPGYMLPNRQMVPGPASTQGNCPRLYALQTMAQQAPQGARPMRLVSVPTLYQPRSY